MEAITKKWLGIERRVTWGNIGTAFLVVFGWALWYAQVSGHVANVEIHPSLERRQVETDARVHLLTDPTLVETNRRLGELEKKTDDLIRIVSRIDGKLEAK